MQIEYDHLAKLFMVMEHPAMDTFWNLEGRHYPSGSDYRKSVNFIKALENDIKIFQSCLPTDGQTSEVKEFLKKYWLERTKGPKQ